MRTWLPSQVYRDEAHASSVLTVLISCLRDPGDPRLGPYVLGVQLKSTGALIGHVGFSPLDDDVEVGFAIERSHQRKGLATEAVRAGCEWVTEAFPISSIVGVTDEHNVASQGVLQRAGFAWQRHEEMEFQGRLRRVSVFAFARGPRQN